MIDDLSKRIRIQVKSLNKIEVFKMDCHTNTARIQRRKNTQPKIKLKKLWKNPETTYCLGCEDYTNNFKSQEVKMKSNCIVCRSSK